MVFNGTSTAKLRSLAPGCGRRKVDQFRHFRVISETTEALAEPRCLLIARV